MSQSLDWLPEGVDLERPSAARCYDFYLGGAHNFEVDRELGRKVLEHVPNIQEIARNNRAFLRRAVRYCLDQGIDQFLDLGSGIPTAGNVHEIVHAVNPDARVVYVDNESVAVAHSRTMLEGVDNATVVQADMLDADEVLASAETQRLLDFSRPVAVMMVAVMHFVGESAGPREIIRRYGQQLVPGSYLGFSHITDDDYPEGTRDAVKLYESTPNPVTLRSRQQVRTLLDDFELIEPGVVYAPEWRPDAPEDVGDHPEHSIVYTALGRKS